MNSAYSKYRNKKILGDGYTFDSKKEYARYCQLKTMLKARVITDLYLQPEFEIIPKMKDEKGKTLRAIKYIGDFKYTQDGNTVVEDTKGFATDVYKIKKRLFLLKYPEYIFKES